MMNCKGDRDREIVKIRPFVAHPPSVHTVMSSDRIGSVRYKFLSGRSEDE